MTPTQLFRDFGPLGAVLSNEEIEGPWLIIGHLAEILTRLTGGAQVKTAGPMTIAASAVIEGGPVFIGEGAEIRAHAYIRGPAYIGPGAIVGHASEIKNSVLLANAKAPHFNYVGDSVLGVDVNLGAGVKLANYRLDGREIKIIWDSWKKTKTGLTKLGALIGDGASLGCNATTNPGTVVLPGSAVWPNVTVGGLVGGMAK